MGIEIITLYGLLVAMLIWVMFQQTRISELVAQQDQQKHTYNQAINDIVKIVGDDVFDHMMKEYHSIANMHKDVKLHMYEDVACSIVHRIRHHSTTKFINNELDDDQKNLLNSVISNYVACHLTGSVKEYLKESENIDVLVEAINKKQLQS